MKYFTDDDLIASLRQQYNREDMYRIDFKSWLHTLRDVGDVLTVQVEYRIFYVDKFTGNVIGEKTVKKLRYCNE